MGIIKLSQKVKRPPVIGARYWALRDMADFMPDVAYDVPVEGPLPTAEVLHQLTSRIYTAEAARCPDVIIGVHAEPHDQGYLTITIGCFAT